jgi:MscS family membrane protein
MPRPALQFTVLWLALAVLMSPGVTIGQQSADPAPTTDSTPAAETPAETASPSPPPVPEGLRSPRATMVTFLKAMGRVDTDDEAWAVAESTMDYSLLPVPPDEDVRRELCEKLYEIINRIEYVQAAALPDHNAVAEQKSTEWLFFPRGDSVRHGFIQGEAQIGDFRISLSRQPDGRWLFDGPTVAGINNAFEVMQDLPVVEGLREFATTARSLRDKIRRYVSPALVDNELLTIEYWQWIALFVIILLGLAVDMIARLSTRVGIGRLLRAQRAKAQSKSITLVLRPLGLAVAAAVWVALLPLLGLPVTPEEIALAAARTFGILCGTWAAWRAVDLLGEVLLNKAARTATKFDDVLVPLLRKTLKIFIVAVGLIYAANSLHINIIPMLTGLGIGGLAFAFAAKDTIENFFGSVAVVLDRPFEVGDWVVIGDTEGIVEEVGFRSTRIRTFYNSQVTVPNAALVRATVDNYGRRKYRRWKTNISIQYDTPPDRIIAFCEGIRELVRTHPYMRRDYFQVYLNDFADSSLDILLYVFFEVPDWSTELRERERLFLDILRLADQLGVQFAFPTQTVHLYTEEHGRQRQPSEPPQGNAERRAARQGIMTTHKLIANQPWQQEKPGPVQFATGPTKIEDDETQIEDRTAGA